jgi:two-component system, chemotaxis family, CheB/CheR fusion protein
MKRDARARTSTKRSINAGVASPAAKKASAAKKVFVPAVVTAPSPTENGSFPIVGVGASAGGLEAYTQLLKAIPPHPGMAFVMVPHLDPHHTSAMRELLSHATPMPVQEVSDGMQVTRDTVYVIPPNQEMKIAQGTLRLNPRGQTRNYHMPIDIFLRSLAEDQHNNAIGVILSGTASDGTLGLAAVKGEGGITFAQDPKTAKYGGMPSSAVSAGCVDFVLAPDVIAEELLRIRQHPYVREAVSEKLQEEGEKPDQGRQAQLNRVFRMLRESSGVDFSEYKPGTIRRRISRRMAVTQCNRLSDYLRYLHQHGEEVQALHHDLLISVTSFFRNPEAFEALKEVVYPAILKDRKPGDAIRIWVPGCSTGEEAYSHAITLLEYLGDARADFSIQIFGTDLSEKTIRAARNGVYKESIGTDVSSGRLRRFFTPVEGGYQISKSIRDMCVFATQNLFSDPPFSRMDIVSCRNVLIYMSPVLQRRIMPILHYALKPVGFLMVGNTEGIVGTGAELFDMADRKHKLYRKRPVPSPMVFRFNTDHYEPGARRIEGAALVAKKAQPAEIPLDLQKEADRLLLAKYVPAAVVVNESLDILQTRGHTSRYLELPTGKASLNLLKMARPGLMFELQDAIRRARKAGVPVKKQNIQIDQNGHTALVNIEVVLFKAPANRGRNFLIVFEDVPAQVRPPRETKTVAVRGEQEKQVLQLQQELAAIKEYLQATIESQEATNEELQSANEEIQSSNEELQSTNEELQTSKEELESANEELNTVNDEMQHRNQQLAQLNNDLTNFLSSVSIPMVMLGPDLSIRRYTPQSEQVLGLISADVGRPITHVRLKINVPDLEMLLNEVIANVSPAEQEIQDQSGAWHRLRLSPYRTTDNRIEGAVLTLMDINALKRFNEELVIERANLEETFRQMPCGLVLAEVPSGKVLRANDQLKEILGYPFAGLNISDYVVHAKHVNGEPYQPAAWPINRSMKGEAIANEEMEWRRADGTQIHLSVSSAPVKPKTGAIVGVMAAFFDRTQRHIEEAILRESEQMAATGRLAAALAHEINNPLEALANLVYLLGTGTNSGKDLRKYVEMARLEVDRIAHISKSLLGLYRGEAPTESFPVRKVVEDVLEVFDSRIAAANVRMFYRCKSDGVMQGSFTEVRQVLLNLVGNALEAVEPKGTLIVRISPSCNWRSLGVRGIRITVANSGSGIPRELRSRVFEPFFTTKGSKGTGLGLWVSKGIVHRYSGTIGMRSRTDSGKSGTVFSVFFPSSPVSSNGNPRREKPGSSLLPDPSQEASEAT